MNGSDVMRAICYEGYGDLDVLHIAKTAVPGISETEVLIRVESASVNPVDWKLRTGMLQDFLSIDFPVTPGRDGCGTIVRLGKDVVGTEQMALTKGQRVSFISSHLQKGSLAEFVAVQASNFVVPAAENLSNLESAALPLVGLSAWNALVDTANLESGMRVLIHGGSGGVGAVAIQIAQHLGAEVFATCSAANAGKVVELGAEAIAYDKVDFVDAVSGCDVVLDTVGGQVHEMSYNVLKRGGCLVYLQAAPFRDLSRDFEVTTRRAIVLNQPENLRRVIDLAASGAIRPLVSHSIPFKNFKKAFEIAEAGHAGGKIVINIDR